MNFSTPLSQVFGIGPVFQKRLGGLGMKNVRDLLFYFPREYEDFSNITPIEMVKEGRVFCVSGKILEIAEQRTFKKHLSITQAILQDQSGAIKILWFNQPYLVQTLHAGDSVYLAGKVVRGKEGLYLSSPVYEKIKSELEAIHLGRIVPVYPETRGISSRWLRSIIKTVLSKFEEPPGEFLPAKEALSKIHFPHSLKEAQEAKKRFAFEELFFILLFILSERKKISEVKAPSIPFNANLMKRFTEKLPFALTDGQKQAAWHILKDIEKPRPMNRLLEGDVGSGKTVVAAMAVLSAIKNGYQAVFMAPTEILAQQHFKSVAALLTPFKITIGLLTGSADRFISPKLPNDFIEISREKLVQRAKEGTIDLLIGTHALIQDKVKFSNLALVILDEQHRFGVKQRAALLRNKSSLIPHLLSLTATPIPRTLALTIYGDLDISLLKELPAGRKKIITKIIPPEKRSEAYKAIEEQARQGRQVFVICPRIEKTSKTPEGSDVKTVKEEYAKLSTKIFPDLKVAMLHGKMSAREKEETMKKMKRGKIDVLVSTSVVEVGVDIPNASVMMIEGADHFGLAQLHQFRGRVGRAEYQSYCFVFTETNSSKTTQRLQALAKLENGFELAEMDLKIRGPGDFAGTKQWGMPDFAMEQLANLQLVQKAREAATKILEQDIALRNHPLLKARVQELKQKLHLE